VVNPTDLDLPGNWGRWGADGQLGTLNLIDDDVRAKAAAEVRTGRWVSLAQPIISNPMISSPFAPKTVAVSPVQQMMSHTGVGVAADLILVTNHHAKSTRWRTGRPATRSTQVLRVAARDRLAHAVAGAGGLAIAVGGPRSRSRPPR
jgi:hypothetical protein